MEDLQKAVQSKIYEIRGRRVILDRDIAYLYGVETRVLNQAVKRHVNRFPEDFMFQLTKEECLRSQVVTLNMSQGQHLKYMPYAFTELGVAMLSSVLRSETAIQINIGIMRAFVSLRNLSVATMSMDKLEMRMNSFREYVEDVFSDQNDINEDTRMQLELISRSLAELQSRDSQDPPRRKIGYV